MAYKLNISGKDIGVNFNVRYENLAKAERPNIIAKAPNGKEVKYKRVFQGQVLGEKATENKWLDDEGNVYAKSELTFWYEGQQVQENSQTKVFDISGFQPLNNYTDNYIIDKYYELYPDNNGMKKDFDRQKAIQGNLFQMRKLWEYLNENNVVARGEFCTSSRGFIASDGYIRAIKINGNKWGLEIGVFKEEKIFEHLQEGVPQEVKIQQPQSTGKKLKRI